MIRRLVTCYKRLAMPKFQYWKKGCLTQYVRLVSVHLCHVVLSNVVSILAVHNGYMRQKYVEDKMKYIFMQKNYVAVVVGTYSRKLGKKNKSGDAQKRCKCVKYASVIVTQKKT